MTFGYFIRNILQLQEVSTHGLRKVFGTVDANSREAFNPFHVSVTVPRQALE